MVIANMRSTIQVSLYVNGGECEKFQKQHNVNTATMIIYMRPISCNQLSKQNSVFFIFHRVKYKEERILFGRFILGAYFH